MTWPTIALTLSVLALCVCLVSTWVTLRLIEKRDPVRLSARLDELEGTLEHQATWWKKLNANMASIRAQLSEGPKQHSNGESSDEETKQRPGETPQQWKERMRRNIAAGSIHHK